MDTSSNDSSESLHQSNNQFESLKCIEPEYYHVARAKENKSAMSESFHSLITGLTYDVKDNNISGEIILAAFNEKVKKIDLNDVVLEKVDYSPSHSKGRIMMINKFKNMVRTYKNYLKRYKEILDTVQSHLLMSLDDKKNLKTIIAYSMTFSECLDKLFWVLDAHVPDAEKTSVSKKCDINFGEFLMAEENGGRIIDFSVFDEFKKFYEPNEELRFSLGNDRIAFNSLDELNLLIKTQPQFVVFDFKSPFEAYLYLSRMPYQFYNDLVLQTQQILDETKIIHEDRTAMENLFKYIKKTQTRNQSEIQNYEYKLIHTKNKIDQQLDNSHQIDYFFKVKIAAVHPRVNLMETVLAVHNKGLVFFIKSGSGELKEANGLEFWPNPEITASKFENWEIIKKLIAIAPGDDLEFINKKYPSMLENNENYLEISYQLYDTLAKRVVADSENGTDEDILIPNLSHEGQGLLIEFENSFSKGKFIDYLEENTMETFEEMMIPNDSDNVPIYDLDHRNMNLDAVYLYKNMAVKERHVRNFKKIFDQCVFRLELTEEVYSKNIITNKKEDKEFIKANKPDDIIRVAFKEKLQNKKFQQGFILSYNKKLFFLSYDNTYTNLLLEHYFEYTNTQSQDLTFIKKPFNRCSQLNPDLMEDLDEAEVYKEVIDELTHDGLKTNYSIIHEMQHVGKNLNEEFERTNVLCLFESNEDFEILSKEISREKIRTRRETLVGKFNEIFEYDIALNKLWFNRNIKIENIDDADENLFAQEPLYYADAAVYDLETSQVTEGTLVLIRTHILFIKKCDDENNVTYFFCFKRRLIDLQRLEENNESSKIKSVQFLYINEQISKATENIYVNNGFWSNLKFLEMRMNTETQEISKETNDKDLDRFTVFFYDVASLEFFSTFLNLINKRIFESLKENPDYNLSDFNKDLNIVIDSEYLKDHFYNVKQRQVLGGLEVAIPKYAELENVKVNNSECLNHRMSLEEKGLLNTIENENKIKKALASVIVPPKIEPATHNVTEDHISINQFIKESGYPNEYMELQSKQTLDENDSVIPEFSSKSLKGSVMKTNFLDQNKVRENHEIVKKKVEINTDDVNLNMEEQFIPRIDSSFRKNLRLAMYGLLAMPVTVLILIIWIFKSKFD